MAKPVMGEYEDAAAYLVGRLCLIFGMVLGSVLHGAFLVGTLLIGVAFVVRDLLRLRRISRAPKVSGRRLSTEMDRLRRMLDLCTASLIICTVTAVVAAVLGMAHVLVAVSVWGLGTALIGNHIDRRLRALVIEAEGARGD